MEKTFLMVKPDGVVRGLVGQVISRVERKGLVVSALKMMIVDKGLARRHYAEHVGKPFFDELVSFITSGPVVAMVVEGDGAIKTVRIMVGKTDPKEASPGSIRGDLALEIGSNIVHASDSQRSAKREIDLFF
jgi:nucleoside-diphosphate kinase